MATITQHPRQQYQNDHSPTPPPTTISPTCIIADAAVLTGKHPIIISSNAILHPRARIVSTHGPVTIGEGCIVSEKASVGLLNPPSPLVTTCADASANVAEQAKDGDETPGVVLEKDVVLEPAAVVEAERVCEGTVLEAGSKVGAGAILGKVSGKPCLMEEVWWR